MTEKETRALLHVNKTKKMYESMSRKRRDELAKIYDTVTSFNSEKRADWSSSLKVNFASQIENLITARLSAKNPKFVVSLRTSVDDIVEKYYPVKEPKEDAGELEVQAYQAKLAERKEFEKEVYKWADAVQTYLNYAFDEYGYSAKYRQSAKALVRYGNVYGTINYKQEKFRKRRGDKIEEVKWKEYPDVDIVSWTEMYLDPRYIQVSDSPAVIRSHQRVRLSELYYEEDLINLDKINVVAPGNDNQYKQEMYAIKMENAFGEESEQLFKHLTVDKYFGYFRGDDEDVKSESLYEIWAVNGTVLIKFKEIPRIMIHSAGCFEDTEQHFSVGYIEPMLGLEREYNFKLNSAIEYINQSLNRSWFWDPNSGINPKSLASLGPGSIIPVTGGTQAAESGLKELDYRQIPQEYFANNNEIRRDIQSVTFTVDTTAPNQQQGFTNTATAVRARFFESNTVYSDTLKHLEEFWTKLAYDIIDSIAENAEDDVVIAKMGEHRFKYAKPEMFEDAPIRYNIRIELGSSSFDSIENRRDEAMAFWNLNKDAKASGVNADLERAYKESIATFEKKNPDEYIVRDFTPIEQAITGRPLNPEQVQTAEPSLNNPAELTKAVVQGNLQ